MFQALTPANPEVSMQSIVICVLLLTTSAALALTPQEIEALGFDGSDVPEGQSGLSVKLRVLLDRAGISPGGADGYKAGMSESALLGYVRVTERLAERFHMDEDFLKALNRGFSFDAGAQIWVADIGASVEGNVSRIEIRKSKRRAVAFDAEGQMVVNFPVAIGSASTPSPQGSVEVLAVAMDATYSYLPDTNFVAEGVAEALILPPGPNGPVGSVWIDMSKPTYGLHGTDTPASLFQAASHGCVRFTNWDVEELAHLVKPGTAVDFLA
jgi:lipoprotein-anchoring transpeptidase ErfK/SrfK